MVRLKSKDLVIKTGPRAQDSEVRNQDTQLSGLRSQESVVKTQKSSLINMEQDPRARDLMASKASNFQIKPDEEK